MVPYAIQQVPVVYFIHSKLYGQKSLAGCSPWGSNKSEVTEQLSMCLLMLNS